MSVRALYLVTILSTVVVIGSLVLNADYFQYTIADIESIFRTYPGTLTFIGTLVLITLLALITTIIANNFADRRELSNRRIQAELTLSEFRQKWINELRADIALLVAQATKIADLKSQTTEWKSLLIEMKQVDSRIRLRLNPDEKPAQRLDLAILNLVNSIEHTGIDLNTAEKREQLTEQSRRYLKAEWDVLKRNLKRTEGSFFE